MRIAFLGMAIGLLFATLLVYGHVAIIRSESYWYVVTGIGILSNAFMVAGMVRSWWKG